MEHSGIAKQSLQPQHTEWCMVNQQLHHKLNSTKNPRPAAPQPFIQLKKKKPQTNFNLDKAQLVHL